MQENVINIDSHTNFSGYRGSLTIDGGILKEKEPEVRSMEIIPKEYTDQRIDSLEKLLNQRFDSNERLISEKMDHLTSRIEGAINNQNTNLDGKIDLLKSNLDQSIDKKLNTFKEDMVKDQKESKRHTTNTTLTIVGIATAIIIGVLGFII